MKDGMYENDYVLVVKESTTWLVKISADSKEEAKEVFNSRGIHDLHNYVPDEIFTSNTTVVDIANNIDNARHYASREKKQG